MNPAPPLRAITFDLDDTLWEIGPVIRAAEARMEGYLRRHFPAMAQRLPAGEVRRRMNALAAQRPELAHHVTALRMTVLREAAHAAGDPPQAAELAFGTFIAARNAVTPFTDAAQVLRALGARFALASITNGNVDLAATGLADLFRIRVSAESAGMAKPHPAIFHLTCEALGVAPEETLHIGDDPECDVAGARAAGLRTIWFNRPGHRWPGPGQVPIHVRQLSDLLERLLPGGPNS
jgi:putative hydrolase of the HAD superfamily